jgi:NAD(P)-dependent dehydrogenase (short-subunit alcohol dehydrogenase family)
VFEKASLRRSGNALFDRAFDVHVKAPFFLTRDFARRRRNGQVVTLLDTRVSRNQSAYFAYTLSKKTLFAFTRMAAVELAPRIRVNGIAPGLILPPEGRSAGYLDRLAAGTPLKRRGGVEEVLACLDFLIHNPYVTGQILYPDGGEHL